MRKPSFREAWHKSQFALIPVQTIYEPYYKNGKSQRWGIYRKDNQPFTVAAIYEVARIQGEIIRSMSMLTINATNHPLISWFHCPKDEKRSIVVIPHHLHMDWLKCHYTQVMRFLKPISHEFTAHAMPRPPKNPTKSSIRQDDLFWYAIVKTVI